MKITNSSMKLKELFDLNDGNLFFYESHYYIAGEVDYLNHKRECYNLSLNVSRTFSINHTVYVFDDCELIIR